jgi:hypothetical protein
MNGLSYNASITWISCPAACNLSFTFRPLYPRYPLGQAERARSRFGRYGEEKNLLALPGIEPRMPIP